MLCRCWAYLTYTWVFLHLWMFSHFINMNGGKFLLFSLIYFMWVWRDLVMMGTVKVFETRNFTKNYSNCPWIPIKSEKSIWTKHLRLPNIILEDFKVFVRCDWLIDALQRFSLWKVLWTSRPRRESYGLLLKDNLEAKTRAEDEFFRFVDKVSTLFERRPQRFWFQNKRLTQDYHAVLKTTKGLFEAFYGRKAGETALSRQL